MQQRQDFLHCIYHTYRCNESIGGEKMHKTTGDLFHRLRSSESGILVLRGAALPHVLTGPAGCPAPGGGLRPGVDGGGQSQQILRLSVPAWGTGSRAGHFAARSAGAGASLEDAQRLLAVGGCGSLCPRVRRDAAVLFALNQRMSLLETEELLSSLPERSLCTGAV